MEKKVTYFVRGHLLPVILLVLSSGAIYSQGIAPFEWASFVKSKKNILVQDTFKLQTFNNSPTDNWGYTKSENATLFDAKAAGIKNSSDGLSLKLPPTAKLIMETYLLDTSYEDVRITFPYAAYKIMKGENLILSATRGTTPIMNQAIVKPEKLFSIGFREKIGKTNDRALIQINLSPTNAELEVRTAASTQNGFYAIDSIYAFGIIPAYTLFNGKGDWSDKSLWSHLPAARHRKALINGDITIDNHTSCHELFLGNGSLHLPANHSLTLDKLTICNSDIGIHASGTLAIKEKILVHKSFPEKGKWYFISFPFHIYVEDIDPSFSLGDETTEEDGNFFYIRQYNGDKRAISGSATGNWEVLSIQSVHDNDNLLFEKGKGYLIALDKEADKETLSFSAKAENIPVDFGRSTSISIDIESGNAEDKHQGWYLCGNPLPAPLHLSEIVDNPALDGNIYCYDGINYNAYPIGSDQVIAPFSTFFVKSQESTRLEINASSALRSSSLLISPFMESPIYEPETKTPASSSPIQHHTTPNSYVEGELLHITDLPSPGKISIIDFCGRLMYTRPVPAGASAIPMRLKTGAYILQIEVNNHYTQHKFVWNK